MDSQDQHVIDNSMQVDSQQHDMMSMMQQLLTKVSTIQSGFHAMEQSVASLQTEMGIMQHQPTTNVLDDTADSDLLEAEQSNASASASASSDPTRRVTRSQANLADSNASTSAKKHRQG